MELPKQFEAIEQDADWAPVKDVKWYGKEDQTDYESIHDRGKGDAVVVRFQEYKTIPGIEKLPTEEEILTPEYERFLHNWLWGDGLRMVMKPRVSISKEKIVVAIPCQAAAGQSHLEEPKLLQEWI